jgi:hypothetical protein
MERSEEMARAATQAKMADGHYVDWHAILGGSVVAVAVGSVFAAFGAALGLSTISAEPGEGSLNFMILLSGIWVVVSLVASYSAGGYIAGRMRRRIDAAAAEEVTVRDGINGLVVWGVGIVLSVVLLGSAVSTTVSTAGSVVEAAGSVAGAAVETAGAVVGDAAGGALSAAGALVPEAAKEDPMGYVSSTLLRPAQVATGAVDPDRLAQETTVILGNVLATGEITEAERAYLLSAVAASSGAKPPEAEARVEAAVTAAQSARAEAAKLAADAEVAATELAAEAEDRAIKAAELARVSAILSAFLLAAAALVAAAAAYIGAVRGGRHRDEGRIFGGFAYRG